MRGKIVEKCADYLLPDEPGFKALWEDVGVNITDRHGFQKSWTELRARWREELMAILRETDADVEEWAND